MTRHEKYLANRKALKELSVGAKMLVKEGAANTVNEALIEMYEEQTGANKFRTFVGWKKEGYKVKKGEKAFLIWGTPKKIQKNDNEENEDDEFKYFPLCYLFSDKQVEIK